MQGDLAKASSVKFCTRGRQRWGPTSPLQSADRACANTTSAGTVGRSGQPVELTDALRTEDELLKMDARIGPEGLGCSPRISIDINSSYACPLQFRSHRTQAVKQGLAALLEAPKDLRPFWRDIFAPNTWDRAGPLRHGGPGARGGGKFKGGAWAGLSPTYRLEERALSEPADSRARRTIAGVGPAVRSRRDMTAFSNRTSDVRDCGHSGAIREVSPARDQGMPPRPFLPPPIRKSSGRC